MNEADKINCIILASGLSERFGSNKLLVKFRNKPLIEWVLISTKDIFNELIVVTRYAEIQELCDSYSVRNVIHNKKYKSDTIKIGINSLNDSLLPCAFIAADQPFLTREINLKMTKYFCNHDDKILRLSCGDDFATPVIFPSWAINDLLKLSGNKDGRDVMFRYQDKVAKFEVKNNKPLLDIDTLDMYKMLE